MDCSLPQFTLLARKEGGGGGGEGKGEAFKTAVFVTSFLGGGDGGGGGGGGGGRGHSSESSSIVFQLDLWGLPFLVKVCLLVCLLCIWPIFFVQSNQRDSHIPSPWMVHAGVFLLLAVTL